jgi:hypothetical protein
MQTDCTHGFQTHQTLWVTYLERKKTLPLLTSILCYQQMIFVSKLFINTQYPNTNLMLQQALTITGHLIIVRRNVTIPCKCFGIGRQWELNYWLCIPLWVLAGGGAVGWGSILKSPGRGFDSRYNWIFFSWPNPSSRTMALGQTQPMTEMDIRNLPRGKGGLRIRLTTSLSSVWPDCPENVGISKSTTC